MAMMRRFCAVGVLVGLGLLLVPSQGAAAEGDWLDEAAGLVARLDKISTADIPPYGRQHEYLKLLDEVSAFAQAPTPDERERKGRKTFGLLLEGRIQEQLGDGAGAVRAWQGHRRDRDALPEAERAALLPLLERTEGAAKAGAARICEVEARGKEVRVRAVGYPLVALLEKMSEATGMKFQFVPASGVVLERMEAALGEKLERPPGPSGLVDYAHQDWKRVDHSLGLLSGRIGLYASITEDGGHVRFGVWDPQYMASLSERAAKLAPRPKPTPPQTGIQTGYVILNGRYVAPPYRVTVRDVEGRVSVFINGLPAGKGFELEEPLPPPPKEVPGLPESDQFTDSRDLCAYAAEMFLRDRKELGLAAASEKLKLFLLKQDIVQDVKLYAHGSGFRVFFTDGTSGAKLLDPMEPPGRGERPRQETQTRAPRARAEADRLKASITTSLEDDGLVLVCGDRKVLSWNGPEGRRKLLDMCTCLAEAVRSKEQLDAALWPLHSHPTSERTWEIFLNLRHREVWDRLQRGAQD